MPDASTFPILCAELLRAGHRVRFQARGPSMAPAIRDGDLITLAPPPHLQVRRGDVVLYLGERGLTAHRVVGWRRDIFLTQGDAPGSPREQVPVGRVLGRVEVVDREGLRVSVRRRFARQVARIAWLARRVLAPFEGQKAPRSRQRAAEGRLEPAVSRSIEGDEAVSRWPAEASVPRADRARDLLPEDARSRGNRVCWAQEGGVSDCDSGRERE